MNINNKLSRHSSSQKIKPAMDKSTSEKEKKYFKLPEIQKTPAAAGKNKNQQCWQEHKHNSLQNITLSRSRSTAQIVKNGEKAIISEHIKNQAFVFKNLALHLVSTKNNFSSNQGSQSNRIMPDPMELSISDDPPIELSNLSTKANYNAKLISRIHSEIMKQLQTIQLPDKSEISPEQVLQALRKINQSRRENYSTIILGKNREVPQTAPYRNRTIIITRERDGSWSIDFNSSHSNSEKSSSIARGSYKTIKLDAVRIRGINMDSRHGLDSIINQSKIQVTREVQLSQDWKGKVNKPTVENRIGQELLQTGFWKSMNGKGRTIFKAEYKGESFNNPKVREFLSKATPEVKDEICRQIRESADNEMYDRKPANICLQKLPDDSLKVNHIDFNYNSDFRYSEKFSKSKGRVIKEREEIKSAVFTYNTLSAMQGNYGPGVYDLKTEKESIRLNQKLSLIMCQIYVHNPEVCSALTPWVAFNGEERLKLYKKLEASGINDPKQNNQAKNKWKQALQSMHRSIDKILNVDTIPIDLANAFKAAFTKGLPGI